MSSDEELARYLAEGAGALLVSLREAPEEPDQLRKMGDLQSHTWLMEQLEALCPGDAVLSEEGADDPARLAAGRVWIVDPLDGTREYGETGRTDWAVHVALWERGELSCGAVAIPARGVVLLQWHDACSSGAVRTDSPCRQPESAAGVRH